MKINCWEKKDRLKKLFLCDPTWVGHSPQGMCHSVWNWDYYLASFSFGLFLFGSWYTALQHGYKDEKETVQRFELAILVCAKMDHYSAIKLFDVMSSWSAVFFLYYSIIILDYSWQQISMLNAQTKYIFDLGSGCGTVDWVVASFTWWPRFKSNHQQFTLI